MAETFEPGSSTNVARATYDATSKDLTVEFKTGNTYTYSGVPQDIWFGLQHASSAGGYLYRHIKDRFPTQQV